jgi:hypothetical protein
VERLDLGPPIERASCLAFSSRLGPSLIVLRPCSVNFRSVMYVAM